MKQSIQKQIITPLNESVTSLSDALVTSLISKNQVTTETSTAIDHLHTTINDLYSHNKSLTLTCSLIKADNRQLHNDNHILQEHVASLSSCIIDGSIVKRDRDNAISNLEIDIQSMNNRKRLSLNKNNFVFMT